MGATRSARKEEARAAGSLDESRKWAARDNTDDDLPSLFVGALHRPLSAAKRWFTERHGQISVDAAGLVSRAAQGEVKQGEAATLLKAVTFLGVAGLGLRICSVINFAVTSQGNSFVRFFNFNVPSQNIITCRGRSSVMFEKKHAEPQVDHSVRFRGQGSICDRVSPRPVAHFWTPHCGGHPRSSERH